VIVATPLHLHAQHFVDALAAGKDLYAEKTRRVDCGAQGWPDCRQTSPRDFFGVEIFAARARHEMLRVEVHGRGHNHAVDIAALQQARWSSSVSTCGTRAALPRGARVASAIATTWGSAARAPDAAAPALAAGRSFPTRTRSFAPSTRDAGDIKRTAPPTAACFRNHGASSFLQFCGSSWHTA